MENLKVEQLKEKCKKLNISLTKLDGTRKLKKDLIRSLISNLQTSQIAGKRKSRRKQSKKVSRKRSSRRRRSKKVSRKRSSRRRRSKKVSRKRSSKRRRSKKLNKYNMIGGATYEEINIENIATYIDAIYTWYKLMEEYPIYKAELNELDQFSNKKLVEIELEITQLHTLIDKVLKYFETIKKEFKEDLELIQSIESSEIDYKRIQTNIRRNKYKIISYLGSKGYIKS